MSWLPVSRTVPVAHRGYSAKAPENTLVAYREALAAGATHVECDVHMSADGTPYVIHDPDVARTTGQGGKVAQMRDTTIDALEAGAWKGAAYAGEPIPKLTSLLNLLKGKASLALEVKAKGMEEAVMGALRATGFPSSMLTLFAFDFGTLVNFRGLEPDLHCTYLVDRIADETQWAAEVAKARDAGMKAIGPGDYLVTARRVEMAHAAGLSVFVWTVDDPERMRELSACGVDAIMTNDPPLALRTLK